VELVEKVLKKGATLISVCE